MARENTAANPSLFAVSLALGLLAGASVAATREARAGGDGSRATVSAEAVSLEIDGDSSLHRYHATAREVRITVGVADRRAAEPLPTRKVETLISERLIKTLELVVSVAKLDSGDKRLDDKMHETLKGKQYPEIRFRMDSYDVLMPSGGAAALTVVLHGRLRIAGVERRIDVGAAGLPTREGLTFDGSKNILMTDYGIKPPRLILGTITAADLITVKFRVTLRSTSP